MISREEAIGKLYEYWGSNKLIFQAEFHVPKNITLREGSKPFGYFRNIRFNGEILEYPLENTPTNEKRVSIYQVLKDDLQDQMKYEVTLDLAKDDYRKKNPFQLIVKKYKKLEDVSKPIDTVLHKTIKGIFNENININSPFQVVNLANSVESLATDIYSEDKRFIYELIQNADDAALDEESELSISILNNYVVISHNGAPFNSRDIRGLCSIGLGTKTNDSSKTGYKGIGFKSVFGQPDGLVYVKTEHTLFKFDREYSKQKGWNATWGNKIEWEEKNGVTFQCPWQMMPILLNKTDDIDLEKVLNNENYTVKTAIKIVDSKLIYDNIFKFFGDAKFLLFLRRIAKLEVIYNNNKLEFKKVKSSNINEIVSLIKNEELLSNWYVKSWIHNIPSEIQEELKSDSKTPKKIQSMEKTEISFAVEINESLNEIKLLDQEHSVLYSYLPTTEKEYNIPFIVNCNFLLDASREKIHKNRKWNEWLFQVIGYKTVEFSSELLKSHIFETTYLSIFRNGFYTESDNLRAKLNTGLKIGLEIFPILKNRDNEFYKLHEVLLDQYELNQVDSELANKIALFIDQTQGTSLQDGNKIIELNKFNETLLNLSPLLINEDQLMQFFASDHIQDIINIESNYKILLFLKQLQIKDSGGSWYTVITKNPLIVNQYGEIDYIKRVCFPLGISKINKSSLKNILIHDEVFDSIKDNTELIEWLRKLGVTEPGSIAYLEKEIIGNIEQCITPTNYIEITKFVYKIHSENLLTKQHYIDLQELPLKTNQGFLKANKCILSPGYNPTIDFKSKLPKQAYLSDDYLQISDTRECKLFFKSINVRDDIEFVKKHKLSSTELPATFVQVSNSFAKEGHTYPHLIGIYHPNNPITDVPYVLQYFSFLDQTSNFEFAKLFWNRIFEKYSLSKDKDSKTAPNYCPSRDFTTFKLGGGNELASLDVMGWGWYTNNLVHIPSYIIWYFKNQRCIPTNKGLKLTTETFVNSEDIIDLAGDFLPIIDIDTVVPYDWNLLLNLREKLNIEDLFTVLENISDLLESKGYLDKENEKRLGLIYNEILSQLNLDFTNTYNKIKKWSISIELVSSSKKCIKASDLLHIKIKGFENTNSGIDTIYIPKNVDITDNYFFDLLEALGIKIIDEFSFEADYIRELYDLKIKLLRLIGPVCLLLKNRMIVSDIDKSMYERFIKISKMSFNFCNNIHPIFKNKNQVVKGVGVNYYHDKTLNSFLISINWKNPVSLLEISYELSSLLTAVRLEKEIMMLLTFNSSQIEEYLINLKLDLTEYLNSEIYNEIITEIEKINELENPKKDNQQSDYQDQSDSVKQENNINNVDTNNIPKSETNSQGKSKFETSLDSEEIEIFKKLFGRELEENELIEENLFSQVKALRYFKDNDYNIEEAENNFNENRKSKLISPIINEDGIAYKVMCRSARKGILFLGAYAWKNLEEKNTILFILTGDKSTDNIIVYDQYELETSLHSYYKVIRRVNTTVEDISALLESETNLKDTQFLYKVNSGDFDIIFNPKQNKPGETSGPVTDIGDDDI